MGDTVLQSTAAAGHSECWRGCTNRAGDLRLCVLSDGSSQGPTRLFGPVTVLRVLQQPHLKQIRESHSGVFITGLSPVAEGGASLQEGSASGPTPARVSVQPGLSHAHSHRGTAVQRRPQSLLALMALEPPSSSAPSQTQVRQMKHMTPTTPKFDCFHLINPGDCSVLEHKDIDHSFSQATVKNYCAVHHSLSKF